MTAMRVLAAIALIALLPAIATASSCSDATTARVNPAFHATAAAKWAELSDETEFRRFRVAHVASSVEAYPAGSFSGRGVVMTAAANPEVSSAYVAITKLRATGNTLPVELFHAGAISDAAMAEFEALEGVTVRSVSVSDEQSLVPAALKQSSFEEVLMLSPRTHALVNPASVFESAEYARTGLMLWPSLHKTAPANPIWSILNTECVDAFEQSSGAAVVHKAKAWAALNVAAHFRGSFYQSMVNGDDSILALGAKATNTEVHVAPASQAVGAHYTVAGARQFCAHSTVLAAPASIGGSMFMHTAGSDVAMAGSQGEGLTCLSNVGEAAAHDEAVVAEVSRLQASVPAAVSAAFVPQACTVSPLTEAQSLALARGTFAPYGLEWWRSTVGSTVLVGLTQPAFSSYVPNCGSYFGSCAVAAGVSDTNVATFVFNVTSPYRGSQFRFRTASQSGRPSGGAALLRVMSPGLVRDYCSYGSTAGDSTVYHNITQGSYALVAVAWALPTATATIPVEVMWIGAISGASMAACVSLPLLALLALLASVLAQ